MQELGERGSEMIRPPSRLISFSDLDDKKCRFHIFAGWAHHY